MIVKLVPCPHCGAMLTERLVEAIKNPMREESCPRQPKTMRRIDAAVATARQQVTDAAELAAHRMVAYAMLGGFRAPPQ